MAPELPQAVWFQVFDYLRDARAFLQCEAVAKEHRDLLRDETVGKKLWEARPIAYGNRLFATGGPPHGGPPLGEWHRLRDWERICDGSQSYTTLDDLEVPDGGRQGVLEFACLDAIAVEQRSDGPIILAEVDRGVWRRLVEKCFDRAREEPRALAPRRFFDVRLTNELVRVATDMVEGWFNDVTENVVRLATHRDSATVTFRDIKALCAVTRDMTLIACSLASLSSAEQNFNFIISDRVVPELNSHGFVSDLGVAADRVMRRFVRKAGGFAYDGAAYRSLWKILLIRLCDTLDRCALHCMSRENIDLKMVGGNPPSGSWSYWVPAAAGPPERRPVLTPVLEDLLQVATLGPERCGVADSYVTGRWYGDDVCSEDGSFRSDDCPDTDDDDDSSIGDESAPPSSVADRLASLASLRASGALTEAEFARQALELGLSGL